MNGIQAIPRTHNGEGLAYISPEEAIWLRQMGGGVPTDPQTGQRNQSQQLLGPGNVPSFLAPAGVIGGHSFSGLGAPPGQASIGGKGGKGGKGGPGGFPGFPPDYDPNPLAAAALAVEEEPYSNVPTEEEIAERQARLNERIFAGGKRYRRALASLGYGPPQALYGQTSTEEQLFPEGRTAEQIPAWAGLFGSPAGESIRVALDSEQPAETAGIPAGLLERVTAIAEQLRPTPTQTAAHGGLIGRYDLGGLVNSMMLQASRSRDNIPSNMVL